LQQSCHRYARSRKAGKTGVPLRVPGVRILPPPLFCNSLVIAMRDPAKREKPELLRGSREFESHSHRQITISAFLRIVALYPFARGLLIFYSLFSLPFLNILVILCCGKEVFE
jgi:hypothetical protein